MREELSATGSSERFGPLSPSYVIPFGRILGQNEGDPPVNEVMVGREAARASFIDLLVSRGPTGSYLVTGRRGVGKSSFVRHCLEEYTTAVFKRFLRGNAGKSLWDLGVLAGLLVLAIFAALIITDLTTVLIELLKGPPDSPLLIVVVLAAIVLSLFPLLYARHLIDVTIRTAPPPSFFDLNTKRPTISLLFRSASWTSWSGFHRLAETILRWITVNAPTVSLVGVSVVASVVWWLLPSGAAAVIVGRLLVALCGLYLITQLFSFRPSPPKSDEGTSWLRLSPRTAFEWVAFSILLGLELSLGLFRLFQELVALPLGILLPPLEDRPSEAWNSLSIAMLFLAAGAAARTIHQRVGWTRPAVRVFARNGSWWYIYGAVLATILSLVFLLVRREPTHGELIVRTVSYGLVALTLMVSLVFLHLWHRGHDGRPDTQRPVFRPRARMLLLLKAISAIVIGLQLAHPGITGFTEYVWRRADDTAAYQVSRSCIRLPIPLADVAGVDGRAPERCRKSGDVEAEQQFFGHFVLHSRSEEFAWGLAVLLLLAAFFYVEYEWVVRPFISARDEHSLDPAQRPRWEDQLHEQVQPHQRFLYRQMERLTFPWMVFTAWLPTLTVTVNLGFDHLDHRSVIHSMLVGLRNEYHRRFMAWDSAIANIERLVFSLVLMFVTAQIGNAWFDVPPPYNRAQDQYFSQALEQWLGTRSVKPAGIASQPQKRTDATDKDDPAKPAGAASPPSGETTAAVKDAPFTLVYKGHPDDTSDRYCRFFAAMRDWELQQALEQALRHTPAAPGSSGAETLRDAVEQRSHYSLPAGPSLLCSMGLSDIWFSLLYFDLFTINGVETFLPQKWLLFKFVDTPHPLPFGTGEQTLSLRVYHVLLFLFLLGLGRWMVFWLPVLPYRRNLQKIDELLDSLSSRTVRRRGSWKPAQWVYMVLGDETPSEVERAPADSRTIELAFLEIVRELQAGSLAFLRGSIQPISVPAPEITFVFDELDKLGINIDAESSPSADSQEDIDIMGAERQRSLALHRLMSDMKRLLSAAPARFIFVGGRQLHDEWLADQTSRQPLLTSIFNAEIYLPSLLTDHSQSQVLRDPKHLRLALHDRIREFFVLQHFRAGENMMFWVSTRWRPWIGLSGRLFQPESFFQPTATTKRNYDHEIETKWDNIRVLNPHVPAAEHDRIWEEEFLWSLTHFLTYRSAGNPKRLRELTLGFLAPVGRVVPDKRRWSDPEFSCHDVLYFADDDIFRVQLLDSVYRYVIDLFGSRIVRRDDKIAVSLFFLADFLFKFHRRAFAWSNLERIEELVHIHRAPDLRQLLGELVAHANHRFLHRVLNGLYAYRFRSEVSREIEYLSRRSENDLAAFNFTLDESQTLKRLYLTLLRGAGADNPEVVAGLGELYEFDEEFETARDCYRKAITLVDRELERLDPGVTTVVAMKQCPEARSLLGDILAGAEPGSRAAVALMPWGLARLRLMLQIGMTFELSRNMERADAEYRSAMVLAERLFDVYLESADIDVEAALNRIGRARKWSEFDPTSLETISHAAFSERLGSHHALKHLGLIFQPVFAIAWLAEKMIGDIDTSTSIVESYMDHLRRRLPFVRSRGIDCARDGERTINSNYSLIAAELHRKAGDLYFLKGRQTIPRDRLVRYATERRDSGGSRPNVSGAGVADEGEGPEGFLLRAHYHYTVSLHELRRHVHSRMLSSNTRFTAWVRKDRTILPNQFPSFIHLALANALSDLSDSMMSRVQLLSLIHCIPETQSFDRKRSRERTRAQANLPFQERFREWFGMPPKKPKKEWVLDGSARWRMRWNSPIEEVLNESGLKFYLDDISDWVGDWEPQLKKHYKHPVRYRRIHRADERFLMVLRLSSLSAEYFKEGGYYDDAAREYMQCCETVCTFLWWIAGIRRLSEIHPELLERLKLTTIVERAASYEELPKVKAAYLRELERLAIDSIEHAVTCFHAMHLGRDGVNRRPTGYLDSGVLPPALLTLACSLHLSVGACFGPMAQRLDRLEAIIRSMAGDLGNKAGTGAVVVRDILECSIRRSRYPILNRLSALHVLINAGMQAPALRDADSDDEIRIGRIDHYVREWLDLIDGFDAPMHFGPLFVGTTLMSYCLELRSFGIEPREGSDHDRRSGLQTSPTEDLRANLSSRYRKYIRTALHALEQARQMHTMGSAYYEAISSLYYLYDDFNDRHIHFLHGLQMAGTELITIFTDENTKTHLRANADRAKRE